MSKSRDLNNDNNTSPPYLDLKKYRHLKLDDERAEAVGENFFPASSREERQLKPLISALGLDLGQKRIGVAGCDGTGLIATGLTTIENQSFASVVAQLQGIIQERQVQVLVIGLPYSLNGSLGFQARQVQKFAQRLAKALQLPMEYMDERLTSYQAEQLLRAEKRSSYHDKGLIDRKAAALILQQWLDERRSRLVNSY